jgi:hypothetical protein
MLLVIDGATASAATGRGRMAEMRRDGCCCVTLPAGGCCCEPATQGATMAKTAANESPIGRRATVVTPAHLRSPGSTCQCRTNAPAAPSGRDELRPQDGRGDPVRDTSSGLLVFDLVLRAPSVPTVGPRIHLPKLPLYLRTTRLLI